MKKYACPECGSKFTKEQWQNHTLKVMREMYNENIQLGDIVLMKEGYGCNNTIFFCPDCEEEVDGSQIKKQTESIWRF